MISSLPIWIDLLFIATVVATLILFYLSNGRPKRLMVLIGLWSVAHSLLAYNGFYDETSSIPPRFGLVLLPAMAAIIYGMLPRNRQWLLETRNTELSTFLHTVRLPVEIVLYALFLNEMVPKLMTFEGRNYDIIMGITAPLIVLLSHRLSNFKMGLLIWNIVGVLLVSFILINGILSAELPFQQFAFDQPNKAVMFFPYVLLPATIVPIVLWTHLSDIIYITQK